MINNCKNNNKGINIAYFCEALMAGSLDRLDKRLKEKVGDLSSY